jgi:hypothetical protein
MRDRDITVNTVSIDIERPPADGRAADVVAYLPGLTVRRRQGLEAEGHRQPFPVFPDCLALSVGRQGGLSGQ